MKKRIAFTVRIISLLLIVNIGSAVAEVGNPFTVTKSDEFTRKDKEILEKEINENFDRKIMSLENKLNRELQTIKESSRRTDPNVFTPPRANPNIPRMPGGGLNDGRMSNTNTELSMKLRDSQFIGCIDDKPLFKENRTKEQFFVTQEEAKENEDFNKMGDCDF